MLASVPKHIWREITGQDIEFNLISQSKVEVPAAVAWLRIAGPRIYRYINEGKFEGPPYVSQVGIRFLYGEESLLWHGEAGLNFERWDFWKKRLREIKRMDCLLKGTRSCADNMEAIMKAIETEEEESLK